jgi:hypothetical protein
MASKNSPSRGSDAAYITPKFIPDFELQGRDDSGGPEFQPYTAAFGDGGYVTGAKAHLSASGGSDDGTNNDEQSDNERAEGAEKALGQRDLGGKSPAKSTASQKQNKS